LTEIDRSTAIPGLSREQLYEITIPLPSPAEQDQIVAVLDVLRSRQMEAELNIARVHHTIERYRQSILFAACSGRLTADWRTLHGADVRVPSQRLTGDGELPAGWTRATVDELAEPGAAVSYGIVKPGPEVPGGVPYVRQQDIIDGTVLVDQLARTSTELASKHQRTALQAGDVLLCIIRNLRVAIVPPGIDGANITQGMVRIRPGNRILGEYLAYYLSAPNTQQRMRAQYVGLAMPRINVRDARELSVDVPPLDEQFEIVNRIKQLFLLADELEQRIDIASRRVDLTMQAVLGKAFRGALVGSA
jgi:type I restriction enzyme S subunit